MNVRADRAAADGVEELFRCRFNDDSGTDVFQRLLSGGALPAFLGGPVLRFDDDVEGVLPGARRNA
jgi:hypothetical protein